LQRPNGHLPESIVMEINPNRNVDPLLPAAASSKARPAAARFDVAFEESAGLNAALAAMPDTRSDVVARAKQLVSQASYPPSDMIQRIANLLAASVFAQA
jgi:hypothetical protein